MLSIDTRRSFVGCIIGTIRHRRVRKHPRAAPRPEFYGLIERKPARKSSIAKMFCNKMYIRHRTHSAAITIRMHTEKFNDQTKDPCKFEAEIATDSAHLHRRANSRRLQESRRPSTRQSQSRNTSRLFGRSLTYACSEHIDTSAPAHGADDNLDRRLSSIGGNFVL